MAACRMHGGGVAVDTGTTVRRTLSLEARGRVKMSRVPAVHVQVWWEAQCLAYRGKVAACALQSAS
jgi:hypothetical protein